MISVDNKSAMIVTWLKCLKVCKTRSSWHTTFKIKENISRSAAKHDKKCRSVLITIYLWPSGRLSEWKMPVLSSYSRLSSHGQVKSTASISSWLFRIDLGPFDQPRTRLFYLLANQKASNRCYRILSYPYLASLFVNIAVRSKLSWKPFMHAVQAKLIDLKGRSKWLVQWLSVLSIGWYVSGHVTNVQNYSHYFRD